MSEPTVESRTSAGVPATLLEYLHGCPVCRHTELRHYCRVPSLFKSGEFIHYERCGDCGVVLRNPRLPTDYRLSLYEDKVLPDEAKQLNPKSQIHYAHMMRLLDRLLPPDSGRRLLDFGCGSGGFLVEARKAGFDVAGLELNIDLARHVTETYDIPTFQGLVSDSEFAERFNVVISSQVFEHLVDPLETLQELKHHLEPPGIVLIEVPNLHDIRERLNRGSRMNDSHLFYFNGRSLSRMFQDCGFRVLKVQQGLRPYRYFSSYGPRSPAGLFDAAERVLSAFGIRSGLGVIAQLH